MTLPLHQQRDMTAMTRIKALIEANRNPRIMSHDEFDAWMKATDKEEAIRLMDRIPAQDISTVADDAFGLWAYRDYEEAVRWLAGKLGEQGDFGEVEDMVNDAANMEVQLPLLRSLPEGTVRNALAAKVAAEMAEADPLAALDFAHEAGTSDEVVARVYDAWSENDPVAALNHLAGDADAPAEAWEEVTEEAFKKDPEIAAQAIETLSNSPARDTAIRSMVKSMVEDDPLQAGAWALALGDPDKRKAAIEEVFGKVSMDLRLARDPATAEELRQQLNDAADLPEAERQHWSDRIDREFTGP